MALDTSLISELDVFMANRQAGFVNFSNLQFLILLMADPTWWHIVKHGGEWTGVDL